MILCIGPTPAAQRVMVFQEVALDNVNRAITTLDGAAGKGLNVAKVLKALGEEPVFIGLLGGERGEQLRNMLDARAILVDCATVQPGTRQCITVIDQKHDLVTELVEESKSVPTAHYEDLLKNLLHRLEDSSSQCRAVTMSGTITPGGPIDFYLRCTQLARKAGALAVVDAKGELLERALTGKPDLIKPNRAELAATLAHPLTDERSVLDGMQVLRERGAVRVVVTAGRSPTLAFDGRTCWRILAPNIQALNPIGSGDAFTAGITLSLIRGDDLGEACRWGCAAGTANALTLMAGEVDPDAVNRLSKEVRLEQVPL
jgi:tagatose 6-phosphate kinase